MVFVMMKVIFYFMVKIKVVIKGGVIIVFILGFMFKIFIVLFFFILGNYFVIVFIVVG